MEYRFNFNTEEEKDNLIKGNSHLTLIKIAYHLEEKFLIFTDEEIEYELTENEILANKIDILETENKALKEELVQIQASIASLMVKTLEEK